MNHKRLPAKSKTGVGGKAGFADNCCLTFVETYGEREMFREIAAVRKAVDEARETRKARLTRTPE